MDSFNKSYISSDCEIKFFIEEVPNGLGFVDKIRLKRMYQSSINGSIIKSYFINRYLVLAYTDAINSHQVEHSLFFKKIEFLKKVFDNYLSSEIWILKEEKYNCIGMLDGYPIFVRSFDNVYDTEINLESIEKSMFQYSYSSNLQFRLFRCDVIDFNYNFQYVIEHKEDTLMRLTNGIDLSNFCSQYKTNHLSTFKKQNIFLMISFIYLIIMFCISDNLNALNNEQIKTICFMKEIGVISDKQYKKICNLSIV